MSSIHRSAEESVPASRLQCFHYADRAAISGASRCANHSDWQRCGPADYHESTHSPATAMEIRAGKCKSFRRRHLYGRCILGELEYLLEVKYYPEVPFLNYLGDSQH